MRREEGGAMPGSGTSATDAAATASAVGALRTRVLGFVESQRLAALGPGRYRYSASVRQPTLYSSSYAAMTRDLLGVANGVIGWMLKRYPDIGISDDTLTPVVAECDDSRLNDSRGPDPRPGTAEGGLVPGGVVPQDPAVHLVGVGIESGAA
jgi:hypothetical protein